jgi:hypothetical protein
VLLTKGHALFRPAMTLGDRPIPHTWGFLCSGFQQHEETSRAHVWLVATHQQNLNLILFKLNFLFKSSNIVGTFTFEKKGKSKGK